MKGHNLDISPYTQFSFYEPVYYLMPMGQFPFEKKLLGRWLGVSESSHDVMAFHVLTATGRVITQKSIWALFKEEMQTPTIQASLMELDQQIWQKIGDLLKDSDVDSNLSPSFPDAPDNLVSEHD